MLVAIQTFKFYNLLLERIIYIYLVRLMYTYTRRVRTHLFESAHQTDVPNSQIAVDFPVARSDFHLYNEIIN